MNARGNVVAAAFRSGLSFAGVDVLARRGDVAKRLRGFCVAGDRLVFVDAKTYREAETRELVVETEALGELYPPRPRDRFELDDGSGVRVYSAFAEADAGLWRFWNGDPRFVVAKIVESEAEGGTR